MKNQGISILLRIVFISLGLFQFGLAHSESFPSKPIRVISVGAGGATDLWARTIADKLSIDLDQPAVVENHPGAANMVAANVVAKAPGDGYTIGLGSNGSHALNVSLFSKVPYDPVLDFSPITLVGHLSFLLVVDVDSPIKSIEDFVRLSKESPDGLTVASTNSTARLIAEMFKTRADINMIAVPYAVGSKPLVDLMGGRIDAMVETVTSAVPLINSGKIRALAVSASHRTDKLPDVPTFDELGYKGFSATAWVAFFGPAGISTDRIAILNGALRKILSDPEMINKLSQSGLDVETSTPEELGKFVKSEIEKWREAFEVSGMEKIN